MLLLKMRAYIWLFTTENGGRNTPTFAGYCPHAVADGCEEYLGIWLLHPQTILPGEETEAAFWLMYPHVNYDLLNKGAHFKIMEGTCVIGEGWVLERYEDDIDPRKE
ncbi:MAG: hypothetical protein ACYDCO_14285 [Armatimonadota bacterium]